MNNKTKNIILLILLGIFIVPIIFGLLFAFVMWSFHVGTSSCESIIDYLSSEY